MTDPTSITTVCKASVKITADKPPATQKTEVLYKVFME